jgi:hypothetical protein
LGFLRIFFEEGSSKAVTGGAQRSVWRVDELKKTSLYTGMLSQNFSFVYCTLVQYTNNVSDVDKMNEVNYRSSYDRWRFGGRFTVANSKVSTSVLRLMRLGPVIKERRGCQHFVCFSVWILPVTSLPVEGSFLYLFRLKILLSSQE